jgi:hypothetical protein
MAAMGNLAELMLGFVLMFVTVAAVGGFGAIHAMGFQARRVRVPVRSGPESKSRESHEGV